MSGLPALGLGALGRLLLSRRGSSSLGVLILLALIWYVPPFIGFGEPRWRVFAGLAVIVCLLGFLGARWAVARWKGGGLVRHLGLGPTKVTSGQSELAEIRSKMAEAVAALRASELGAGYRGSAALYALPWYMLIGASATGKSTLIRNSGLHFPTATAEQLQVRGIGGTRNCDWWFSDQAVLLDTAGRYTTEQDDREEWLGFLDLLKRYRSRLPLNGLLVAVSVEDLLIADADTLEQHVRIIRERMHEVSRRLSVIAPTFLIFTKCDLIKGFYDYFQDLDDEGREQLWGAYLLENTLTDEEDAANIFERHVDTLYRKLCEQSLGKMSRHRGLAAKAAALDFPNQFAAAMEKLTEFVRLLFRDSPYHERPTFAGVYFTSGTQQGTPVQRLIGNLREAFGYSEPQHERVDEQRERRPFFVKRLFTDVIFPLQYAGNSSRRSLRLTRCLKVGAVAGGLSALTLASAVLVSAYASNQLLLRQSITASERLRETAAVAEIGSQDRYGALSDVYMQLEKLKTMLAERHWRVAITPQVITRQLPALEALLLDELDRIFRFSALAALESQLAQYRELWDRSDDDAREALRETYYNSLRAYLMVTVERDRLDPEFAGKVFERSWIDATTSTPASLAAMIGFYLEWIAESADTEHTSRRARNDLVEAARKQLRAAPDAARLYAQLQSRSRTEYGVTTINELLSSENRDYLYGDVQLPLLYTVDAWHEFVRPGIRDLVVDATRGDWVTGSQNGSRDGEQPIAGDAQSDEVRALERRMRERYFLDYSRAWEGFLGGLSLKRLVSLTEAVDTLSRYARSDGPLGQLMQILAVNLDVTERGLPKGTAAVQQATESLRLADFDRHVADLRHLAVPGEDRLVSPAIHEYLGSLLDLRTEIEGVAVSSDPDRAARRLAADVMRDQATGRGLHTAWIASGNVLASADGRTRDALQRLFQSPVRRAWALVLSHARADLSDAWQGAVIRPYRSGVHGRFPFHVSGPDAALDDVQQFFQPGTGLLPEFLEGELVPFIARTANGFTERRWLGAGLGLSADLLEQLHQGTRISDALFRDGGRRAEIEFHVTPVPSRGVSEMLIESNGQRYRYRNEPEEWRLFVWPGSLERIGARVSARGGQGRQHAEMVVDGPWAIFRLLNRADRVHRRGAIYDAEWNLQADSAYAIAARFRFRVDREDSLLDRDLLADFSLPDNLFQSDREPGRLVGTR